MSAELSNGDIPSGGYGIPMERSKRNLQRSEADTAVTKRTQILLLSFLAVSTAIGPVPARADDNTLVWGKAVDGFQMAISLDSTRRLPSGAPAIRLHFRNVDNAGIDVGLNLECDRPEGYRSDLMRLALKNSSEKSERLADTELCSGRQSYFRVPIPVGATYSMPVNLDYRRAVTESGMARDFESQDGSKDTYTVQGVMTIDLGQEMETVTSNDLVISGSQPAGTDQREPDWGAAVNDLQMAISLGPPTDTPSRLPAITLHLRNIGANDLRIGLGGGCFSIEGMPANGVILSLKDSSGNIKQLKNFGPRSSYLRSCAGAAWIFLVPMAPGAVYSVPLELEYYRTSPLTVSPITRDFERGWQPGGTYTLQAVLKWRQQSIDLPGLWFGKPWAGNITSEGLEVHFPTQ